MLYKQNKQLYLNYLHHFVQKACVKLQDSPLVRAAQLGRALVLDEADKAPLEAGSSGMDLGGTV